MLSAAVPSPCLCCNNDELEVLRKAARESDEEAIEYSFRVRRRCGRCRRPFDDAVARYGWGSGGVLGVGGAILYSLGERKTAGVMGVLAGCAIYYASRPKTAIVRVPLPAESNDLIERAIEASCVAEKGSKYRPHGTFIHHLSKLEVEGRLKRALLAWMPFILDGWMKEKPGFERKLLRGHSSVTSDPHPVDTHEGNADTHGEDPDKGDTMTGTMKEGDEFGEEDRVDYCEEMICPPEPKELATRLAPDIQSTEVMANTIGNLKAGLAKRVQPLPFMAGKRMVSKIKRTVSFLLEHIYTKEAILSWREQNPDFSEMASKKWSGDRFSHAWDIALAEVGCEVEHEFQIKINEALPSKGKAPRPIIQSGDTGQILMMMPVKCFEDLLFDYFEQASIKHCPKHDAMKRIASHLRLRGGNVVEGDGSAWDSCCTPEIRELTENRIIEHIIRVFCNEAQIPQDWMDACLKDMRKQKIRGKAQMADFFCGKAKVCIDAIRQSGHRGTSAFNYLINLVCWLNVLAIEPWDLMKKDRDGKLNTWYRSTKDGAWHEVNYCFEGDDSAICTTEKLSSTFVEGLWTSLGFRMKLVYVQKDQKMTFTGFDFLCDENGPTGHFMPEIARNISSSSWSCSSLLKQDKKELNSIGAAAMLARAENFKDFGPLSAYFASLGLAHARKRGDWAIEEREALNLGIQACDSVVNRLHDLYGEACLPDEKMRKLCELVVGKVTHEEYLTLLASHFDSPFDTQAGMVQLPRCMWGVEGLKSPQR